VKLLYSARIHWWQGESESLKSWAAQVAVAQTLADGGLVLYVDFEDEAASVVERLLSLGVDRESIKERFVYLRPDEPLLDQHGKHLTGFIDFAEQLDRQFDLAIVDGVTEAMTTEGLNLMDNADAARWMRRVPKKIARTTGAAVVVIDHVTKSTESRGRYAIGAQHKLSGVDGATFNFTISRPLSRATSEPVYGAVNINVIKDRPGHIRGKAIEGRIGTLELTAYPDGKVDAVISPPGSDPAPEYPLLLRILEHLDTFTGASKRQVENEVEGKGERIRDAIKWMTAADQGWLRVEKVGQSHQLHITDIGQAELEGSRS
jgi:hypothetical protein